MADYLADVFPSLRDEIKRSPFIEGVVANTPATKDDQLEVRLKRFDGGRTRFTMQGWTPRGTSLPVRGDRCLVVQSNLGRYWCVCWFPA